jgi:hypothetical protein
MKEYFPIYEAFHIRYTGLGYTLRYVTIHPLDSLPDYNYDHHLHATHIYPTLTARYL